MGYGRKWSDEEKEYLKEITPGHHYSEIQELMIKKFMKEYTIDQIKSAISRYKLNTGFNGQFKKGNIPFNKGVKGVIHEGCKKTWFKKGNTPQNHKSIGGERIDVDGYTLVKVAEPNIWKLKHRVLWEKAKGKIPKGYAVIFLDGDKRNLNIENLALVSRVQLLRLNKENLIKNNANLTKTGIIIADLYNKISQKKVKK